MLLYGREWCTYLAFGKKNEESTKERLLILPTSKSYEIEPANRIFRFTEAGMTQSSHTGMIIRHAGFQ